MTKYLWVTTAQPGSLRPSLFMTMCLFYHNIWVIPFLCGSAVSLLEALWDITACWKHTWISFCQRKGPSWELAWGALQGSLPSFHKLESRPLHKTLKMEIFAVSYHSWIYWSPWHTINAFMVVGESCRLEELFWWLWKCSRRACGSPKGLRYIYRAGVWFQRSNSSKYL